MDVEAGDEKTINMLLIASARPSLLGGLGALANATPTSYETLLLDNERFGAIRRILDGIVVDADHLAFGVIAHEVAGGDVLGHDHTLRHLRGNEVWQPELAVRRGLVNGEPASRTALGEARVAARRSWQHTPSSRCPRVQGKPSPKVLRAYAREAENSLRVRGPDLNRRAGEEQPGPPAGKLLKDNALWEKIGLLLVSGLLYGLAIGAVDIAGRSIPALPLTVLRLGIASLIFGMLLFIGRPAFTWRPRAVIGGSPRSSASPTSGCPSCSWPWPCIIFRVTRRDHLQPDSAHDPGHGPLPAERREAAGRQGDRHGRLAERRRAVAGHNASGLSAGQSNGWIGQLLLILAVGERGVRARLYLRLRMRSVNTTHPRWRPGIREPGGLCRDSSRRGRTAAGGLLPLASLGCRARLGPSRHLCWGTGCSCTW